MADYRIQITATKATWIADKAYYELTARIVSQKKGVPLPMGEFIVFDPGPHRKQIDPRGSAILTLSTTREGIFKTMASLEKDPDVRDETEVIVPEKPKTKTSEEVELDKVEIELKKKIAEGKIKKEKAEEQIGHLKTELEKKKLDFQLVNFDAEAKKRMDLEIRQMELEITLLQRRISEIDEQQRKSVEELERNKQRFLAEAEEAKQRIREAQKTRSPLEVQAEEEELKSKIYESKKKRESVPKKIGEPNISLEGKLGRYRLNAFVPDENGQPVAGEAVNVTVSVPGEHEYPLQFFTDSFGRVDEYFPIIVVGTVVKVRVRIKEESYHYLEALPPEPMNGLHWLGITFGGVLLLISVLIGIITSNMAP